MGFGVYGTLGTLIHSIVFTLFNIFSLLSDEMDEWKNWRKENKLYVWPVANGQLKYNVCTVDQVFVAQVDLISGIIRSTSESTSTPNHLSLLLVLITSSYWTK